MYFSVTVDKVKKSEEDGGALTDGENGKSIICFVLLNRSKPKTIFEVENINFSQRIQAYLDNIFLTSVLT